MQNDGLITFMGIGEEDLDQLCLAATLLRKRRLGINSKRYLQVLVCFSIPLNPRLDFSSNNLPLINSFLLRPSPTDSILNCLFKGDVLCSNLLIGAVGFKAKVREGMASSNSIRESSPSPKAGNGREGGDG